MHVAVVGGGIIGMATAYELLCDGHEVTLLEAGELGQEATHGNAAKIALGECAPVPAPGVVLQGLKWMTQEDSPLAIHPRFSPSYLKFLARMALACNNRAFRRGLELHLDLVSDACESLDNYQSEGMDFEMHSRGLITVFEDEEHLQTQKDILPVWEKFGYEPRVLTGDEVFEVEPALATRAEYAVYSPEDRQLHPDTLTAALRKGIAKRGGTIKEHSPVTGFKHTDNKVSAVVTTTEEVAVDAVVLAPGLALTELSSKAGQRVPVFSGKGYSVDYRLDDVELSRTITLAEPHMVLTQLDDFIRVAGTMEFGAKDNSLNPVRIDALRRGARLFIKDWPSGREGEFRQWAGSRPMTADGVPIIGQLKKVPNVYVAGGHGMLGLTMGPGTGKILADMISGRKTRLSDERLKLISPNRFRF